MAKRKFQITIDVEVTDVKELLQFGQTLLNMHVPENAPENDRLAEILSMLPRATATFYKIPGLKCRRDAIQARPL